MFGLAPGSMSDASLSDKLRALGNSFSGDQKGVDDVQDHLNRGKLADQVAAAIQQQHEAALGGGRTLPQQGPVAQPNVISDGAAAVTSALQGQPAQRQPFGINVPALDTSGLPTRQSGAQASITDNPMIARLISQFLPTRS